MTDVEQLVLDKIKDNPGITPREIVRSTQRGRAQVYRIISTLEGEGLIVKHAFNAHKAKKVRYKLYLKQDTDPLPKCVKIKIQPDQAAMWLVKSKPQWEQKLIPIRRSIGLGVRQSMC